jgi:hypothetical protein
LQLLVDDFLRIVQRRLEEDDAIDADVIDHPELVCVQPGAVQQAGGGGHLLLAGVAAQAVDPGQPLPVAEEGAVFQSFQMRPGRDVTGGLGMPAEETGRLPHEWALRLGDMRLRNRKQSSSRLVPRAR